jgi:hypothetical protein
LQAEPTSTRNEFFVQLAGVVAATGAFPGVASAAKYGPLGRGPSSVLDPKDASIDKEILESSAVQKALKDVKGYSYIVGEIKKEVEANPLINLSPVMRKEFEIGKLRFDLNAVNSAFDEDTQVGTDRLIRVILQEVVEVEQANNQKDGIDRSPRRVANLLSKINTLQIKLDDFLAFAGN